MECSGGTFKGAVHALQEMGFFCPQRLRRLRLDQYSMTEQQRRGLDVQLTHNKFRKAAWKLWHDSSPAAAIINKVHCVLKLYCLSVKQDTGRN